MRILQRALLPVATLLMLAAIVLLARTTRVAKAPEPAVAPEPAAQTPEAPVATVELVAEAPQPPVELTAPEPRASRAKPADVTTEWLEGSLKNFDSRRSFDTAESLLQKIIQVEWDANGRYEDVTGKWDEIDPSNGHTMRRMPTVDPKLEGFFSVLDPRGSRWYRFTPQDFPEWWQLHYPDPGSETGTQEGFAMPRKVSADLAQAIRTRAVGLIEKYGSASPPGPGPGIPGKK